MTSKPSKEPATISGDICMFPFVYKGICHNDCIKTGTGLSWCGTSPSVDLFPEKYASCEYNLTVFGK